MALFLDQPKKKAASAAYTYFLAHSEDETSKKNVVYFRDGARVAEADFLDLEMLPYKEHYIRATIAYSEENWEDVVNHMEQCLEEFYLEHQRCELDCETKFFSSDHEFSTGVADWMLRIMTCKSECEKELSKVFIDPTEGFVRDMYSYLQYAYASLEKFDMAVQAAANFLVFDPTHDGMLENKNILTTTEGYTEKDFVPQQEVVDYVQKKSALVELIASIVKNYRPKANMQKHKEMLEDEEEEEYVEQDKDLYYEIEKSYEEMDDTDNWMERYEQLGMNVIARSVDLNRAERYVTDSLLKAEQCDELFKLTEDLQTEPQGSQIFTLKKAQQMLEADPSEDTEASLRLLSRSAEVVRHYTQRYLNPDMDYYLKKITFVCWPPSEEVERKCYPQEDGSCIKFEDMSDELYRDLYTTVTFLHTADDDSDFLFLNEEKGIDGTFGLRCGRTIGFNTGDRHTLNIPKSGSKRCAMVLKYFQGGETIKLSIVEFLSSFCTVRIVMAFDHLLTLQAHTLDRKEDDKDYRNLLAMLHRVNELRMATVEQKPEVVPKEICLTQVCSYMGCLISRHG
ncbi:hypothetical protein RRG08_053928 [Elysia crispata]|uniref:Leprecan-like alpha-helical domain-containing protein n=1 Tax=Elysia crispata TaxID=231223 RepID=A0AAE1E848_9GAST|nr:hypothetical protein RRG08_053928 [Elysia crispata]KAK3797071.1 hypothetical protein RRG08_053928 [Elysia crispata]